MGEWVPIIPLLSEKYVDKAEYDVAASASKWVKYPVHRQLLQILP